MTQHDTWINKGNPLDEPEVDLTAAELQHVADLLNDIANEVERAPYTWTKGVFARSLDFSVVGADSDNAMCWNIHGFLLRDFCNLDSSEKMTEAAKNALYGACGRDIWSYNNSLLKPEQFVKWVREAADSL